jgi:type I restriction enzyme, S subunit
MSEAALNPKLRFPEYSSDWVSKQLGEIAPNISYGLTVRPEYFDIGVPLISAKEIAGGYIDYTNAPKISHESFDKLSNKAKAARGDIFLSKTGTIGRVAYVSSEKTIAITQNIALIRIDNKVYFHQYVVQFLRTREFYKSAIKKVNQSTIMDLQLQDIKRLYIRLPSMQEQQKIAAFLKEVDNKIEQLSKKQELLGNYKKGLMQKIFSQEIRFKADDGSDYPDWEEKKLGDMIDLVIDNRGKTPPVIREKVIPLIEVNSLGKKNIDYNKVSKFVTLDTFDNWFRKYLKNGDILFSTVGQTAVCSIYYDKVKSVIAQNIIGLRFTSEKFKFMFYLLTDKKNIQKFKRIEMGAVQPSVKVSQMIHINFLIPSLSEQQKIANFLSSIDNKIEQIEKQTYETKEFKKALLQQMFV